jgi:hypothetical protein
MGGILSGMGGMGKKIIHHDLVKQYSARTNNKDFYTIKKQKNRYLDQLKQWRQALICLPPLKIYFVYLYITQS